MLMDFLVRPQSKVDPDVVRARAKQVIQDQHRAKVCTPSQFEKSSSLKTYILHSWHVNTLHHSSPKIGFTKIRIFFQFGANLSWSLFIVCTYMFTF